MTSNSLASSWTHFVNLASPRDLDGPGMLLNVLHQLLPHISELALEEAAFAEHE